jgi:hypothetical protein
MSLRSSGLQTAYAFAISRRNTPEVCMFVCPLFDQRAQGRPGACCTRGLACDLRKQSCTRAYRAAGNTPAFPAQWLYGLLRALPGERLFCLRRRADTSTQLSASTAALEPHDFAVRIRRVRLAPSASTASHRTFVTFASAPQSGETGGVMGLIWVRTKAEYFFNPGLDTISENPK